MPERSVWAAGGPRRGLLCPAQEDEIPPILAKGEFRVELTGFTDSMVDRLKATGLISEIIQWKLRLFVPTGAHGPVILAALRKRYPLVRIADRAVA